MSSERYKTLSETSRRIADIRQHAKWLTSEQDRAEMAHNEYDPNDISLSHRPQKIVYNAKTKAFIDSVNEASLDI